MKTSLEHFRGSQFAKVDCSMLHLGLLWLEVKKCTGRESCLVKNKRQMYPKTALRKEPRKQEVRQGLQQRTAKNLAHKGMGFPE